MSTPEEMFGDHLLPMKITAHLLARLKDLKDSEFKAGFEMAIEEMGAYLDSESADDRDNAQTLLEQKTGLVNGAYHLVESKGPIGIVKNSDPKQ